MSSTAFLDLLRKHGLCSRCAWPLTDAEKAYEGVGGSYVRCDKCMAELARKPADEGDA